MNRVSSFPLLFLILAALMPGPVQPARAATLDTQSYRRAFSALDAGHADVAFSVTTRARDPVLNKVLRAYYMAAPGNNASFAEIAAFVGENPDWPNLKDILAIAEQKIPADADPAEVANWFSAHPPATAAGFYRHIDALNLTGQTQDSDRLIRARWVDGDFSAAEQTAFHDRFGGLLGVKDHEARLDRLLWNNDAADARRMYAFVDSDEREAAEARLALASQRGGAERMSARAISEGSGDPGLLYELLRWKERNGYDDDAIDILNRAPDNLVKPEAWWTERQIIVRRAIERRDYDLAYRLASRHGQTAGIPLVQAEFLAGWLALRFLDAPGKALMHFENLCRGATTPISRARGFYWLGRTLEALDDKSGAEQAYENAAAFNAAYYGQLAAARLYDKPTVTARPEPAIPAPVREKFYAQDVIRAVQRLHEVGETGRARTFFRSALDTASQHTDFVLLTELAYRIGQPDLAIEAAKSADQKDLVVATGGYPLLTCPVPHAPESAFTHALIRQESMFNPNAKSSAGAHGLMQLMPQTAKAMARRLNVKFAKSRMANPDYNLKLGTAFVRDQLDSFDGSYLLALAGYNAGPSRVREWIGEIGDPRDPHVDPVDWIELIPVAETRNYIQRIIENLQIYRARLNGGQSALLILNDLKK